MVGQEIRDFVDRQPSLRKLVGEQLEHVRHVGDDVQADWPAVIPERSREGDGLVPKVFVGACLDQGSREASKQLGRCGDRGDSEVVCAAAIGTVERQQAVAPALAPDQVVDALGRAAGRSRIEHR